MRLIEDDSTRSSLLARVASLSNHPAWAEFVQYYDPRFRRWCRRFGLDADTADELCQRMWIELMRRLPTYRYDPGRSFRGWLWYRFKFRALNLLAQRRGEVARFIDGVLLDSLVSANDDFHDEPDERVHALLREGEEIHEKVRGRVKPGRWEAYMRIIVRGDDIGETAAALGMTYAAAYAAAHYVDGMVRAEAKRREAGTEPGRLVPDGKENENEHRLP